MKFILSQPWYILNFYGIIFGNVASIFIPDEVVVDTSDIEVPHRQLQLKDHIHSYGNIPGYSTISLFVDPPNGTFSATALGVYVWIESSNTKDVLLSNIYYSINGSEPTLSSQSVNSSNPYIELTCSSLTNNLIVFRAIAARYDSDLQVWYRSNEIVRYYYIESDQRKYR